MWDQMSSLWSYEENHDMEQLGQKLMCTTLELEKLKAEAMDEMRRNKDCIKQLIHLLKFAIQERDEARIQLQKLAGTLTSLPQFHSDSPLLNPAKANSSITESNSLSETYSFHSPVDSTEFSDMNFLDPSVDQSSLIIDNLAKGRVLPQNGKFLKTVRDAGPLLASLLVAGPLPRWRNPPQFQSAQIPPFLLSDPGQFSAKPYNQLSCATAQVQSSPLLSFSNLGSATSTMNDNGYTPMAKRQRFS